MLENSLSEPEGKELKKWGSEHQQRLAWNKFFKCDYYSCKKERITYGPRNEYVKFDQCSLGKVVHGPHEIKFVVCDQYGR